MSQYYKLALEVILEWPGKPGDCEETIFPEIMAFVKFMLTAKEEKLSKAYYLAYWASRYGKAEWWTDAHKKSEWFKEQLREYIGGWDV